MRGDYHAYLPLRDKYRILSFDFRGHGQSAKTGPYTFKQLVDDIEAMRVHFSAGADIFGLCGGSFGGEVICRRSKAGIDLERVSGTTVCLILRGTAPSYHRGCLPYSLEQHCVDRHADETEAIEVLKQRLDRAPSLSVNQLKNKIFGSFDSDAEFQLVMHAAAPLYSETFDADSALAKTLQTVYFAESHSKLEFPESSR